MKLIELTTGASTSGRDHFSPLPAELLHTVFSFLLPTHTPDTAAYDAKKEKPCSHSLDYVAATCRRLRSEVSEWALHFLLTHKGITKFQLPKFTTKRSGTVNHLRGRKGLLTWSSSHCIFCGKKSTRSAILANGFRCCDKCDKAQWEKITLTDAKKVYGLKEENLLPNKHVNSPTSRKLVAQLGTPRARYGVYTCQGARATMFLLEDVRYLAALVHGELDSYLAKREAARVLRNANAENKKKETAAAKAKASSSASSARTLPIVLDIEDNAESSYGDAEDFRPSSMLGFVDDQERDLIVID